MSIKKILVIDDDIQIRNALNTLLSRNKYSVITASTGKEGLVQAKKNHPDLILSDIMMPEMDGLEMLQELKKMDPDLPVILMTGFSSIEGAIKAIRYGADEYLIKPLDHVDVLHLIKKAQKHKNLTIQNKMMRQRLTPKPVENLIGNSSGMKKVKQEISQSAVSEISILILGESGTGKELISQAIHQQSNRSGEAFVAINCAAIPNELLESELFGHEKGAFSGAGNRKYGLFEMAADGTLFLDEIGEMSLALQAKILRAIETQKIRRIGSTKEIDVDFRLISSTNSDLEKGMQDGSFRSDLYYRISPFVINVPPLRNRTRDLPLFLRYFLDQDGFPELEWDEAFLKALGEYSWPGNIRELRNVIARAALVRDTDVLNVNQLGPNIFENNQVIIAGQELETLTLAEVERQHIARTVRVYNNKTNAAKALGISLKTLYNKLNTYGNIS